VRKSLAIAACGALLAVAVPAAAGDPPAASGSAAAAAEGISDAELDRRLSGLAAEAEDVRRAAATDVANLGPDATAAIARRLAELRKLPGGAVAAAVKPARDGKGGEPEMVEALLRGRSSAAGERATLTTLVLLRALAHAGTTPAVRQLVKVAGDHGGALRPEVAHHLKALGDRAVPALIETRREPSSELRHWALSQLEAMGKRVPGDAVQTKDNAVLTDVLRAFAAVHDMDALPVLLSFVNADRLQVRTAAREALLQFGQDAIWKLREAYATVTGKPAPDGVPAAAIAKDLFAAYDRMRLQEVYGLLDEGLARVQEGKLEEAVLAFDKVLARHPMIERRGEMVSGYVAYALTLEETDPPRALALLRKASRLWPETPRAPQIDAEIAYLEGKDLLARGIVDVEPFQRALTLDPGHEKSRAELRRLEGASEERQERFRNYAAGTAVVVVALLGIVLFGTARRARSPRARPG
jgi:tetratricopeptide (TPR) repeat protein